MPNGFIGVDVFFVISGFLITSIVYKELIRGTFSLRNFYLRRMRRIIPLALFTCVIALLLGALTMLPDDLENLGQSVIATNFFANNILQAITTKNYWDVVNEYKPLMHTWSLGVEEQYYFLYPFLFLAFRGKRTPLLLPALAVLSLVSMGLYLVPAFSGYKKFYFIQFRFWELAVGGIAALLLFQQKKIPLNGIASGVMLCFLGACLLAPANLIDSQILIIFTVILTTLLLTNQPGSKSLTKSVLENRAVVFIGKISFSMYMWHQVLYAFARYAWWKEVGPLNVASIFVAAVILSIGTFYLIERPFRDRTRVSTTRLIVVLATVLVFVTTASAFIYTKAGVIRDVPELEISREDGVKGLHANYNNAVYRFDRSFESHEKIRVLVVGDSFGRDWANVLLESEYAADLELSYASSPHSAVGFGKRAAEADVIFWSNRITPNREHARKSIVPVDKLWIVGTKNFGTSNGIFYNRRGPDYFEQRTEMEQGYEERNQQSRKIWAGRYLDYIDKVIDQRRTVPVFTPDRKFISQDCRHLTKAGAKYFAGLFSRDLEEVFQEARSIKEGLGGQRHPVDGRSTLAPQ